MMPAMLWIETETSKGMRIVPGPAKWIQSPVQINIRKSNAFVRCHNLTQTG